MASHEIPPKNELENGEVTREEVTTLEATTPSETVSIENPEERAEKIKGAEAMIQEVLEKRDDGSESFVDTRIKEEKQDFKEEPPAPKKSGKGLKKWLAMFGLMGVMASSSAKASTTEKPLPDSTKNKTETGVKSIEKINDQIRRDWNEYLKWLDGKKMRGKEELDKNDLGYKLFDEYVATHKTSLNRGVLPLIVKTMEEYREYVLDQYHKGLVTINNIKSDDQFMRRVMENKNSKDPIYPGDDLTFTYFPEDFLIHMYNGKVTATENRGFAKIKEVGPDFTKNENTVGLPGTPIAKNK